MTPHARVLRDGSVTRSILAACSGRYGAKQAEIRSATGCKAATISAMVGQFLRRGLLHAAGPKMRQHYFADAGLAQAYAVRLIEQADDLIAAEQERRKAAAERKSERRRELRAERAGPPKPPRAAKPPKPAKPKPRPNLQPSTPWRADNSKPASVKLPAAREPARIVIPEGVKRTVAPLQRDTRFTVEGPVIGGFATMGVGRYLDGGRA